MERRSISAEVRGFPTEIRVGGIGEGGGRRRGKDERGKHEHMFEDEKAAGRS